MTEPNGATTETDSRPRSVSGRTVLLTMLGVGLSLVLGVGIFAAVTRKPPVATPVELSGTQGRP